MKATIIAIDGPAGVGKGTLAKHLAEYLNFAYLDTGLIYRSLAYLVQSKGVDPNDCAAVTALTLLINFDLFANAELRSEKIGNLASKISVHDKVRQNLLEYQRSFAYHPPKPFQGAILDGRDIGTTIIPEAPIKIFLTASIEARVQRRLNDLIERGFNLDKKMIEQDMIERDERDLKRAASPLKAAENAYILDTSHLDKQQVIDAALKYINSK